AASASGTGNSDEAAGARPGRAHAARRIAPASSTPGRLTLSTRHAERRVLTFAPLAEQGSRPCSRHNFSPALPCLLGAPRTPPLADAEPHQRALELRASARLVGRRERCGL